MTNKRKVNQSAVYYAIVVVTAIILGVIFKENLLGILLDTAVYSARTFLPTAYQKQTVTQQLLTEQSPTEAVLKVSETEIASTKPKTTKTALTKKPSTAESFTKTPDDIVSLIADTEKNTSKDKKVGAILEKTYKNEGVTDSYSLVKVKNTNKTQINVESILKKSLDITVNKNEPSVLIFHSHTTETYQILDRSFYASTPLTRSNNSSVNMVRVGKAITEEIESMGFSVIHDTVIHDATYSTAYSHSKASVVEYLKKYPSIKIVLDIHRDSIQQSNKTKIKPVADINGKKAAQIMIISGCQEKGNGIEDFPNWEKNLIFAVHLQNTLETLFKGITRPLYFCARKYNMNLADCSLLVEVGSDANTLEEAVYTGKCLGKAVGEILKEYEK